MRSESNKSKKSTWKLTEKEIEIIVLALQEDIDNASWTHTQDEIEVREELTERFRAALPGS